MDAFEDFDAQAALTVIQAATRRALLEIGTLCEPDLRGVVDVVGNCLVSVKSSSGQVRSTVRVTPRAWQITGQDEGPVYGEIALSGDEFLGGINYVFRLALGIAEIYDRYFDIPSRSNKRRYLNRLGANTLSSMGITVQYHDARRGYVATGFAPTHIAEYAQIAARLDHYLMLQTPTEVAVAELMAEIAAEEADSGGAGDEPSENARYVFASCGCTDTRGKPRTIRVGSGTWKPDSIRCSLCNHYFSKPAQSVPFATRSSQPEGDSHAREV